VSDITEELVPCICGAGQFLIVASAPDHPWGGAASYRTEIRCGECVKSYRIQKDGTVVRIIDAENSARAQATLDIAVRRFMSSDTVTALLSRLATYLDQKPSVAAVYRSLDGYQLAGYSLGHFRKRWQGGQRWVRSEIYYTQLPKVLAILNSASQEVDEGLALLAVNSGRPSRKCRL
jgi:hypothetical protein